MVVVHPSVTSAAHRKCRASLARGKPLFLRAILFWQMGTYFRRAVLAPGRSQVSGTHYPGLLQLFQPVGEAKLGEERRAIRSGSVATVARGLRMAI